MAIGTPPKNSSEFEEGLLGVSEEDSGAVDPSEMMTQQEFESAMQEDRNNSRIQQLKTIGKEYAKQELKQAAKKVGKKVAKEAAKKGAAMVARSGIMTAITATWEVWLPILLIIGLIVFILFISTASVVYACYDDGWFTTGVRLGSKFAHYTSLGNVPDLDKICKEYFPDSINGKGAAQQLSPTVDQAPPLGTDLVPISGVPVDISQTSDPRLRPCMLAHLQNIYREAQRQGVDFVVTSAYRPGAVTAQGNTSAHSRGEAVDIAIRVSGAALSEPYDLTELRLIRSLEGVVSGEGFNPPQGDTINEYIDKRFEASGGHIHFEFNTVNGQSYCTAAI